MEVDVHGQDSFLNQVNLFLKKKTTLYFIWIIYIYILFYVQKIVEFVRLKLNQSFHLLLLFK